MVKVTAVEKIGGSSLPDEEAYGRHAEFLAQRVQAGERLVVVISAQKGYTDKLLFRVIELGLIEEEQIISVLESGEILSARLLKEELCELGINATDVSYEDIELTANGSDLFNASLAGVNKESLNSYVSDHDIVIVPGFGALHEELSQYVLLGRGGTDYIAVALGAVLGCPVRFRKGSGKIYAVDPSVLPNALPLDHLTYGQARSFVEYSRPGRQFLAMKSLDLAAHYHVSLHFLPECVDDCNGAGTSIGVAHEMPEDRQFITKPFRALAVQDVFLFDITVPNQSLFIYRDLRSSGIPYGDFLEIQEGNRVFIIVQQRDIKIARNIIEKRDPRSYVSRCVSLTFIDSSITPEGDHISRGRWALRNINVILSSSLGTVIRFIVQVNDQKETVKALAEEFGLTK